MNRIIATVAAAVLAVSAIPAVAADPAQAPAGTAAAPAPAPRPLELSPDAPDRHIVVPGDTLWGIAGKFLKEPWRWSEIWHLNKDQVKNPHRIYPGDVIVLAKDGSGNPQLKVAKPITLQPKIYTEVERKEIPSIPSKDIEPFLSQPLVVEPGALDKEALVVGMPEGHVYLGNGDSAYISGADPEVELWQAYRPGKALVDPDTKAVLGAEAVYLGTVRITRPGEPALGTVVRAKEEMGRGTRLIPAEPPNLVSYAPHAPDVDVEAKVISIYGGVAQGGRYSIVALSRGAGDGLERGHVVALSRASQTLTYKSEKGNKETFKTPEERYGLAFVFRVFERISYALVMDTGMPVEVGDRARNP